MNEYKSTQTNELFTALAKAQGEMQNASLGAENPFFKSRYADLADIVRASRPAFSKHGLSVIQPIVKEEDGHVLVTILAHSSGQWIESRMKINPLKTDIQSFGSYVTYLKRYCYASICGVVAGNDDDGEAEMVEQRSYQPQPRPYQQPKIEAPVIVEKPIDTTPITAEQLELIEEELAEDIDLAQTVKTKLKITSLAQMKKSDFVAALNGIRKIKEKKK